MRTLSLLSMLALGICVPVLAQDRTALLCLTIPMGQQHFEIERIKLDNILLLF
jgi:hypothetical protein